MFFQISGIWLQAWIVRINLYSVIHWLVTCPVYWGVWLNFSASSGLTEEQQQIYKTALDFAHLEMRPHMAEWDENVCIILLHNVSIEKNYITRNVHLGNFPSRNNEKGSIVGFWCYLCQGRLWWHRTFTAWCFHHIWSSVSRLCFYHCLH